MTFAAEPTYACRQCLDDPAGWILLRCTGLTCERRRAHQPHVFTVRCPCWLTRNADRIRRQGETAMAENKPLPADFDALTDLTNGRYVWAKAVTLNASEAAEAVDHFAESHR